MSYVILRAHAAACRRPSYFHLRHSVWRRGVRGPVDGGDFAVGLVGGCCLGIRSGDSGQFHHRKEPREPELGVRLCLKIAKMPSFQIA